MSYEYHYTVCFLGGWITHHTILESGQSTSIGAVLSQHNFSRRDGCGKWMAEEYSSSCHTVKKNGATTRGGGRHNTSKEHWITMSKTCGQVVDCWEPTAVTDWSAIPQIERGWLFLSKGIGPKESKRQIAAAVPYQKRMFIIYSMRKELLVILCLSIQPRLHRQTSIGPNFEKWSTLMNKWNTVSQ